MKVKLNTETDLPGTFTLQAETWEESLILRCFMYWPAEGKTLQILNSGSTVGRPDHSMTIGWSVPNES